MRVPTGCAQRLDVGRGREIARSVVNRLAAGKRLVTLHGETRREHAGRPEIGPGAGAGSIREAVLAYWPSPSAGGSQLRKNPTSPGMPSGKLMIAAFNWYPCGRAICRNRSCSSLAFP